MRKYVRLGLIALSSPISDESGGDRRASAHFVAEQLSTLAASFLEWSAEARTSLVREIKELVARQVQEMGMATKKDLERLQRRVDRLEEERKNSSSPKRATKTTGSRRAGAGKARTRRVGGASKSSGRSRRAPGPG